MQLFMSKCRVVVLVSVFLLVGLIVVYELLKPVPNGCIMAYMYPTYIRILTSANISLDKYGQFLYHERWKKIDISEHIKKLDGVPVLLFPGNGGSYQQILDLYQESWEARLNEGADASGSLPTSVILVGHSMGGFVARAAVIHPHLRKSAVETILTLSSPHQAHPTALQPSLGHYFSKVNHEWIKGFMSQISHAGHTFSNSTLSHDVVIFVSGGIYDYQVRSKLVSLDGIVPSSNGFMISSSSMKNVWLSMEH